MKPFIVISLSMLILAACGTQEAPAGKGFDISEKRALLQAKRSELTQLTEEISRLEKEIEIMDPNVKNARRKLVTTGPVKRQNFARYIKIQGAVEAEDLVEVAAETGGRIIKVFVREGEQVKKGDVLVELDLEQLDKQIAELETSLELAHTVFERQSRLWEQQIGSEIQYLQAKNNVDRLEKGLETLRFQRAKSTIYAPSAGVVDRVILQSGELAAPGVPILQILDLSRLKVVASVPENYLGVINRGDRVRVEFPALQKETEASVKMIGNMINPANRTFEVEATLQNRDKLLKPNLLANVLIREYYAENRITLPLELVQQEIDGREFVMVKDETPLGAVAGKKYVSTGQNYEGTMEILEGLDGTETIILEGARGLKDQEPITVFNTKNMDDNGGAE